jgi:1,2-diacylglycerol 3-beta-galactosyltransferase
VKKLDFMFFDAGGGHRSAATALKSVIEQQGRPWEISLTHVQELMGSIDIFRKYLRINMEDVYNQLLARGWTLGSDYLVPLMHGLIRIYHPAQVRILAKHWTRNRPDMVVSVIPNFDRALYQGIQRVDPKIPLVTIITDFADYPPHFWMEKQDQYMICGTEAAFEQARDMGYDPKKIFLTSGMILRPIFYQPMEWDRAAEREKLGLRRDLPTGVVLFGGAGSKVMLKIAERIGNSDIATQLIFICGRNEKLAAKLREMKLRTPIHVVGFTQEVPYFMYISDYMIGKPGPGSISEAMAMKLPVIVERNAWTLPQERFNADWVREKHVGIVLKSFADIQDGVRDLLSGDTLQQYRANAAAMKNRAVFEIPDILEEIMNRPV